MVIVFFIGLFLVLLILAFICSSIKIRLEECHFSNNSSKRIQYDYQIIIEMLFLGKIKIMKLVVNPERVRKLNQKLNFREKIKNIDFNKMKQELPDRKKVKQAVKKLNIKFQEFHLSLELGTKDVMITSALITILASGIGMLLAKMIEHYEKEKYYYKILPVYENKNVIKISLTCILQVKVVHIISIFFTLVKKRKEKKRNERTSNRKSYDYGYEQY